MNLHDIMLVLQLAESNKECILVTETALFANAVSGEVSDAGFTSFDDYFKEEI